MSKLHNIKTVETQILFSLLVRFVSSSLFFKRSQSNTLLLGEGDQGGLALSDDENVSDSGSERVSSSISNVDNIETTDVSISVDNDTDSSDVVTGGDQSEVAGFKGNVVDDETSGDIKLDGVQDVDSRVGESDGSTIVGNDVGNLVGADSLLGDLAKLVLGFFLSDVSEDESSLYVIKNSVKFTSLLDADDVHQTGRESGVLSDLTIDGNVAFLVVYDHHDFSTSKSVLKTVL